MILLEQRFLTVKAQVNLQKGLSNVSMQREGLEYSKTIRKKYFHTKYKIYGKNMINSVKMLNTECIVNTINTAYGLKTGKGNNETNEIQSLLEGIINEKQSTCILKQSDHIKGFPKDTVSLSSVNCTHS